ncbi:MAG: DUF2974 domain-containing protein [Bacteroidales bacterium]|nr:DUF2974 domain-containing protein [Bacteroidales bacterium]MCM1416725.1 DUF2974 domain-containing protein [bacterium]MCM1424118.1 DUF2974 domain-containing protein [bacterium]
METMIGYLKEYGGYSLEEKPFSEVDSLILSQFSYLKFDGIVPAPEENGASVSLKEIAAHPHYDHLYADERYRRDNTALFEGLLQSRRFGDMKLWNYVNLIEQEAESQFSAVVCGLSETLTYVVFRGTDENIVGWKEDLNLAFSEPVPGQRYSVEYLEAAAQTFSGSFYVGGHSKGGNLAVYSSMYCKAPVRERIAGIFDHDGPGFRPEVREKGAYAEIESRIRKTVPRSSVVGMLLYTDGAYRVVESRTLGMAQHNPYTWLIRDGAFRVVDEIRPGRKFMDQAVNDWILSLDQEQMRTFVDTFYRIVQASETDNLIDFTANWGKSLQKIGRALGEVDRETAQVILRIMRALFEAISLHAKEEAKSRNIVKGRRP